MQIRHLLAAATPPRAVRYLLALVLCYVVAACAMHGEGRLVTNRWAAGLGPVLPHDSFPSDCQICHEGDDWNTIKDDFTFDHEAETGHALTGSHRTASCLRCHNDRGHVDQFTAKGCVGCHEDVHLGQLDPDCTSCHDDLNWRPHGQREAHARTRFPLVGAHATTDCRRCHLGSEVGRFLPVDVECLTCHQADLADAVNPNHIGLGWVNRCDRCHVPLRWNQAEINE